MRLQPIVPAIIILVSMLLMFGCASAPQQITAPESTAPAEQAAATPTPAAQQTTEPAAPDQTEEAAIVNTKQLNLKDTEAESQNETIISDLVCEFEQGVPSKFSFSMKNIESKEWVFSTVSMSDLDKYVSPVVVLNAVQLSTSMMAMACKTTRIKQDQTVQCSFDPVREPVVKNKLYAGTDRLGKERENRIAINTRGHAAEITFLCSTDAE